MIKKIHLIWMLLTVLAFGQVPGAPSHSLSWHETLTGSKLFWAGEGAAFLSSVADAEATHQGIAGCHNWHERNSWLPYHPSRGDLYRYNFAFFGGFFAADLLLRKYKVPFLYHLAPVYETVQHTRGALSWRQCL